MKYTLNGYVRGALTVRRETYERYDDARGAARQFVRSNGAHADAYVFLGNGFSECYRAFINRSGKLQGVSK